MCIKKIIGCKNALLRKCREVTVQGKKGFLVEGKINRGLSDAKRLGSEGFYVYGVRRKYNRPWTLEESFSVIDYIDYCGYIVLTEPMVFRDRGDSRGYFTLNNQYSSISKDYKLLNVMSRKNYPSDV